MAIVVMIVRGPKRTFAASPFAPAVSRDPRQALLRFRVLEIPAVLKLLRPPPTRLQHELSVAQRGPFAGFEVLT
jgi:hypothetical protein